MIYGFSGIQETRKSRSSRLISVRRTLHFGTPFPPSLPPRWRAVFSSSQPLASPFRGTSSPTPAPRGGDTFRRGTVSPTRESRKFLSRSRNYNYPLGYARSMQRVGARWPSQHGCPCQDVCLFPLQWTTYVFIYGFLEKVQRDCQTQQWFHKTKIASYLNLCHMRT